MGKLLNYEVWKSNNLAIYNFSQSFHKVGFRWRQCRKQEDAAIYRGIN